MGPCFLGWLYDLFYERMLLPKQGPSGRRTQVFRVILGESLVSISFKRQLVLAYVWGMATEVSNFCCACAFWWDVSKSKEGKTSFGIFPLWNPDHLSLQAFDILLSFYIASSFSLLLNASYYKVVCRALKLLCAPFTLPHVSLHSSSWSSPLMSFRLCPSASTLMEIGGSTEQDRT